MRATNIGSMLLFGNEGGDTITTFGSTNPQSILGGNDSADARGQPAGRRGATTSSSATAATTPSTAGRAPTR